MISEKTVELNLTTELVNYMYYVTRVRPYILAPSQPQEATFGFDTSIGYPTTGKPYLIQYKRAEFRSRKNEYLYHLNHTKKQDQHLRLYALELMGWDVFYALPLFHTPTDVINKRQHLLPETLYLKPSWMIPIGGIPAMVGHHEVRHNLTTGITTIHSDEGKEINQSFDFFDFARQLNKNSNQDEGTLLKFFKDFNSVFSSKEDFEVEGLKIEKSQEDDNDIFNGMSVMVV
jgi:hypothetical protein